MKINIFIVLLATSLISCSKQQPSEIDKADITKKIPECMTKVTTKEGGEPDNIMDKISSFAVAMGEMQDAKKEWELRDDGSVNLTLKTEDTLYSCDYSKTGDREWNLNSVLRNGEKVFDFIQDEKIRSKIKLDNEEKEKKEQEQYLSTWHEKGYNNVDYKYYEKNDVKAKKNNYFSDRPKIVIVCKPEEPYFKYDSGMRFSSEKVKVSFDDDPTVDILITSSGMIGKEEKIRYMTEVYFNSKLDKEFRKKLIAAKEVKIEDYTFTMDNILTVPCIK